MPARTSLTHPLQIAEIPAPQGGFVGVTFCPGKVQANGVTGAWNRDLGLDIKAIADWGAGTVVTLVEAHELKALKVEGLGGAVAKAGMDWLHLPIADVSTPSPAWELDWKVRRRAIHAGLDQGDRVLVHCMGGLGRAGTVAARILVERGMAPDEAMRRVREVRPGAIETRAQERYVLALKSRSWPPAGETEDSGARP